MASSSSQIKRYHVFPSFHGSDVRIGFLSHLHYHFAAEGIRMFKDQEIERGHLFRPELEQAIRESRVSIVVLSKNYASSSWCLDELVQIFKCKEDGAQIVMTIFYDVDPSDVRKQRGDFGDAFEKTCEGKTEEVKQRWSKALAHVATIAGEHSVKWDNDAEMIRKIARDILKKLDLFPSRDVFPSFHGPDVRSGFLSHLHNHFASKGITTFKDNEIERGQTIGSELLQAIRESRVSIVVLSKNYASSSWCLDELIEILKCKEAQGQIVMTIFYDVDPSDVRKQSGVFGIAFEKTCAWRTEDVKQSWIKALTDVANIAGEQSLHWDNEAEMIQKIATDVSNKLNLTRISL